jgi:hypothetical protein
MNNQNQNEIYNRDIQRIFIVSDRARDMKRIEKILYPSFSKVDPYRANEIEGMNTNNLVLVFYEEPSDKIVSKSMPNYNYVNDINRENGKYNSNSESNLNSEWSTSSENFENNLNKNIYSYKLRRPRPMPKWQPTFR